MIVFVYLISDDLQDIYVYICFLFFLKELWAMGAEQPMKPFQVWSWGGIMRSGAGCT